MQLIQRRYLNELTTAKKWLFVEKMFELLNETNSLLLKKVWNGRKNEEL